MVDFSREEMQIILAKIDAQRNRDHISFRRLTDDFVDVGYERERAATLARRLGEKIIASVDDENDRQLPIRRTGFHAPGVPILTDGKCISYTIT